VSSHWKTQITTKMIHFGSLLASSFSIFLFRSRKKTIFGYSVGFSPANLSELLHAVVGVESVSH
jgi:hypothetical protein